MTALNNSTSRLKETPARTVCEQKSLSVRLICKPFGTYLTLD